MESRRHPRAASSPHVKAQFSLGGHSYRQVVVTDLGAGGCRLELPPVCLSHLKSDASLEDFQLLHPSLPRHSLNTKMVWLQGYARQHGSCPASGLQFLDPPPDYQVKLDRVVSTLLQASSRPPS